MVMVTIQKDNIETNTITDEETKVQEMGTDMRNDIRTILVKDIIRINLDYTTIVHKGHGSLLVFLFINGAQNAESGGFARFLLESDGMVNKLSGTSRVKNLEEVSLSIWVGGLYLRWDFSKVMLAIMGGGV